MDQTISRHATTDQILSDETSKLRLDRFSLIPDIQSKTLRHIVLLQAQIGQLPAQAAQPKTEYPSAAMSERTDVQAQTGEAQLQTKHSNSDQTFQFRQRRLTPDSKA